MSKENDKAIVYRNKEAVGASIDSTVAIVEALYADPDRHIDFFDGDLEEFGDSFDISQMHGTDDMYPHITRLKLKESFSVGRFFNLKKHVDETVLPRVRDLQKDNERYPQFTLPAGQSNSNTVIVPLTFPEYNEDYIAALEFNISRQNGKILSTELVIRDLAYGDENLDEYRETRLKKTLDRIRNRHHYPDYFRLPDSIHTKLDPKVIQKCLHEYNLLHLYEPEYDPERELFDVVLKSTDDRRDSWWLSIEYQKAEQEALRLYVAKEFLRRARVQRVPFSPDFFEELSEGYVPIGQTRWVKERFVPRLVADMIPLEMVGEDDRAVLEDKNDIPEVIYWLYHQLLGSRQSDEHYVIDTLSDRNEGSKHFAQAADELESEMKENGQLRPDGTLMGQWFMSVDPGTNIPNISFRLNTR